MRYPRFIVLCAALAMSPLVGCVSQGVYDALLQERDELALDNQKLRQESARLSTEGEELVAVAAGLTEELELRAQQVEQLEREQQELAEELESWIVAGLIKMQLLKDGLHLILSEEILFRSGAAEIKSTGREVLTRLVGELEGIPYEIAVLGYTDNIRVGPKLAERYPSNWELAAARASSVVRLMQEAGIPGEQLMVISLGENRPIASNDTPEGRSENRRTDIRLRPVVR